MIAEKIKALEAENEAVRAEMNRIREAQKVIQEKANQDCGELEKIYNQKLTRAVEIQGALKLLGEWENAEVVGGDTPLLPSEDVEPVQEEAKSAGESVPDSEKSGAAESGIPKPE